MPVRAARSSDIQRSLDHLSSSDAVTRESAVARLLLVGGRAIAPLRTLVAADTVATQTRIAALQTLGLLDQGEAVVAAISCLASSDDVLAAEAVEMLGRAILGGDREDVSDRALEHLTGLALSFGAPLDRRTRAVQLLRQLPEHVYQPVLDALEQTPSLSGLSTSSAPSPSPLISLWIAQGRLPLDEAAVVDAIDTEGRLASVTDLHRVIEMLRARAASAASDRAGWDRVRGEVHRVLAEQGSTLALYDLREALDNTATLASPGLLAAAQAIADVSCLASVTLRWLEAGADPWLRDQCERVFRSIVERERLRRNSAAMALLLKRWPAAGPLVATAPRSRPTAKHAAASGGPTAG